MTFAPPQKDRKPETDTTTATPTPAVPGLGVSLAGVMAVQGRPPLRISLRPEEVVDRAVRAFEVAWGRDPSSTVQGALDALERASDKEAVSQLYQERTGRPLLRDLLRALGGQPAETRDRLSRAYASPVAATLGFDAFVEQLAISAAYSNEDNLSDAKQAQSKGSTAKLLQEMGYKAARTVHGRWGLQMRTFRPVKGKAAKFKETVVAFRGTEGVAMPWLLNPGKDEDKAESVRDTAVGDFNTLGPGYGQYAPNRDLIGVQLKHAAQGGRVVSTGHSLGGALAQIAGADRPELIRAVVSFAAPGIETGDVQKLRKWNEQHQDQAVTARHYRATGDIVPGGGDARIDGQVVVFDRLETPDRSSANRLTSNDGPVGAYAHNALLLRDFLAKTPPAQLTEAQQLVVKYGGVDSQAFVEGRYDPREVTVAVLQGLEEARRDPQLQNETARAQIAAFVWSAQTMAAMIQNAPYEVLLARTDEQIKKLSAALVKRAGGLKQALVPLRRQTLGTESVILRREDVQFLFGIGQDELAKIGVAASLLDSPVPVRLTERQALVTRMEDRWRFWHPGAEGIK